MKEKKDVTGREERAPQKREDGEPVCDLHGLVVKAEYLVHQLQEVLGEIHPKTFELKEKKVA